MAFQWCEGWDAYASLSEVQSSGKWPNIFYSGQSPSFSTTAGKFGGKCITSSYQYGFRFPVTIPSGATFYIAGWWNLGFNSGSGYAGGALDIFGVYTTVGNTLLSQSRGYLTLNNNTSTAVATGTTYLSDGWHWIEASFNLNGASSQVTAYVDGIQQFSGTYNLSNFPAQAIQYLTVGSGLTGSTLLDDFIAWDNTGTTFNTFPLGARRIGLMNPNAAGASTQFTPSANANWQCVSQAFSGTAYVADTGTGNIDLYTMSALPYTPRTNINAVVVNTQATNPSADGTRNIINKLRSGTTNASGTPKVLVATKVVYMDAFPLDSSGAAWTLSSVNASQAGVGD